MKSSEFPRYAFIPIITAALLSSCSGSATRSTLPASTAELRQTSLHGKLTGDFIGCPYQTGDVWQTDISSAKIDANSSAYIKAAQDAGGAGSFTAWAPTTNELINAAKGSTPLVTVVGKVKWHTPYSPWPWQSNFYISPMSDAHAMVLQESNCRYYEGYNVSYSNGTLSMYNGGMWDLSKGFVRPSQGSISTASGIPIGLVAVRPEELQAGSIQHALGWDGVAHSWSQTACVSPAGQTDCTDDITYNGPASDKPMPYGAHLRLKASFNDSSFPTEAKIVAEALKHYGAYGYDTGCCNAIVFVNDQYGSPVWTQSDQKALSSISLSNFDVVAAP